STILAEVLDGSIDSSLGEKSQRGWSSPAGRGWPPGRIVGARAASPAPWRRASFSETSPLIRAYPPTVARNGMASAARPREKRLDSHPPLPPGEGARGAGEG